jgi:hypothetical protein
VLPLVPGDKGARLLGPVPARTTRKKTSDPCSPLAPLSVRTPDSAFCFLSFFLFRLHVSEDRKFSEASKVVLFLPWRLQDIF